MNSSQKDIMGILNLLDYDKQCAYLYYDRETTTNELYRCKLVLTYKEHINRVSFCHLNNFNRLEIKDKNTGKIDTYKIKTYSSLELI